MLLVPLTSNSLQCSVPLHHSIYAPNSSPTPPVGSHATQAVCKLVMSVQTSSCVFFLKVIGPYQSYGVTTGCTFIKRQVTEKLFQSNVSEYIRAVLLPTSGLGDH